MPARHRPRRPASSGSSYPRLLARLDDDWRKAVEESWRAEHDDANEAKARFAELEHSSTNELDPEALAEKARLTHRLEGRDAALPVYQATLERDPSDPVANYVVGEALLGAGDDAGLPHLDRAMLLEPDAILAGCELAESFLTQQGRTEEAERYRAKRFERIDALESAGEERTALRLDADVREHECPPEVVSRLATQLERYPAVKRAYFARRNLVHLDDEFPSYVLVVEIKVRSWRLHLTDPKVETVRRLASELEAPYEVFVVERKEAGKLGRRVRKLSGAEIYSRS